MILFTSSANIFSNGLTIIAGFFVVKWLMPYELGYFNTFTVVTGYIVLAHIGIPVALNRDLPYLMGKQNKSEALKLASTSKYWAFVISTIIGLIGVLISLYFLLTKDYQLASGIFVIVAQTWQGIFVTKYLKVLYRTNKDFNKLAVVSVLVSIISFISIYLIYLYGFYGLCLRAVVIVIVDFALTWFWRPIKVNMLWDKLTFKNLLNVGFPIFLVNNLYSKWPLVERTLILLLLGTNSLGLFTVAFMIGNAFKIFSNSMSSVLYPTFMIEWGKGKAVGQIFKKNMIKPMIVILSLFVIITPLAWHFMPLVISSFLPNYTDVISTSQWMLITGAFGLLNIFGIFYNVINVQKKRLVMYLSGVAGWSIVLIVSYGLKSISLEIFPKALLTGYMIMFLITIKFLRTNWETTQATIQ